MLTLLWLIPTLPLASSLLLVLSQGRLPRRLVALCGVGSMGLAALLSLAIASGFDAGGGSVYVQHLWQWISVGDLRPAVNLYLDGLALVMLLVVTGVGFLIHLYASGYMFPDPDYCRFFAYMNLFVAAMLILVLADNLLLLYLGWEGVGLCSYLLIGFWYRDPANGAAARKAFVVTRIGDTAMAIGLLLLFRELHTLNIQDALALAQSHWPHGDTLASGIALLLLAGAVGKSAQLPLQSWLPDAMAGPTPVSALIHAATMVTAGVYLIARTHPLFLLAPTVQWLVGLVGTLTLLIAGYSALAQTDIKRILAYSTISQIGYMFLALGVGAWSAGIFHLVTHAFFKALLFLSAGALILQLHHQQDIRAMGGLHRRLPWLCACFVIGAACLAALPLTSGFFSKEPILAQAWQQAPLLWLGGLFGAALTALYSARLIFLVFLGPLRSEPQPLDLPAGVRWRMPLALTLLALLALLGGGVGGLIERALQRVLPSVDSHPPLLIELLDGSLPLLAVVLAYQLYLRRPQTLVRWAQQPWFERLRRLSLAGGGFDFLYDRTLRRPFCRLAALNRDDCADGISRGLAAASRYGHHRLAALQNGQIRWYAALMILGMVGLIGIGVLT